MAATRPKSYLIVAKYNRQKWHGLNNAELMAAEDAAENLFPDGERTKPLEDLIAQGEFLAHSFASDIFTQANHASKVLKMPYADIPSEVRDLIIDGIYATKHIATPIGWMVVVDEEHFESYVNRMSGAGPGSGLWSLYDIDIYPLKAGWTDKDVFNKVHIKTAKDMTTNDVYQFMTPTNWGIW